MERIKLETKDVSIAFPGVKALENINLTVCTGEIRAIVGANGAGKSTLMKVLAGANPSYTGDVLLDGKSHRLQNPIDAKNIGIQIVYQEVDTALYQTLSVAENIMQNDMVMENGGHIINWHKINKEGRVALERLHITQDMIDEKALVASLSLAQKQMVLIAKAIRKKCNFLILDEPTAPLSQQETKELFRVVKHLHETENICIMFISHRLSEILEICDSYTMMRNGKIVGNSAITSQTTTKEIVEQMLGKTFEESYLKEKCEIGNTILEAKNISANEVNLHNISLYVKRGEIVGIAGLVGAGKSELCKTLFGVNRINYGNIYLHGKKLKLKSASDAVKNRIALVPEERRKEGILINETVSFNLSAAALSKFCDFSFINHTKVGENARKYIKDLGIATPNEYQVVKKLSGGNQQKVVIGKWLAADCDVYIFDEPTKGVDVGAKKDIFHLIHEIAKKGNAVIYATCENTELLSLTDRIYVMYGGAIMAELKTMQTREEEIMNYAVGGYDEEEVRMAK